MLKQNSQSALEAQQDEKIEYIQDCMKIATYGVMSIPALVIDEQVVSFGKVLNKDEVIKLLKQVGF